MRDPLTTIFGALAAACGALATFAGFPPGWQQIAAGSALVFGALTAFFAKDRVPASPALRPLAGVLVALAVTLTVAGCTLSAFKLKVANPSVGSLLLEIGGGSLGRTNAAALPQVSPAATTTTTNTRKETAP